MRVAIASTLAALALASGAEAATYLVAPDAGDFPTIQSALDAAVDGDEILLASGTFTGPDNRNLDYGGRNVVVRSQSGDPATCVIDCEEAGRGVHFRGGEGPDAILGEITIRNGRSTGPDRPYFGGGILCDGDAAPTIRGCVIEACFAVRDLFEPEDAVGGGLAVAGQASPTVLDCEFVGCFAAQGQEAEGLGGGIGVVENASLMLRDSLIRDGGAQSGGGVYSNAQLLMSNCDILDNRTSTEQFFLGPEGAGYYGGTESRAVISNCRFRGNLSVGAGFGPPGRGGGLASDGDDDIVSCEVTENESRLGEFALAGGVYLAGTSRIRDSWIAANEALTSGSAAGMLLSDAAYAENCVISGNASSQDGAVRLDGDARLVGCTVVGNSGGGVDVRGNGTIERSIVWGNSPCTAAASPCGEQIGALGIGCKATPIEAASWSGIKQRCVEAR